MRPTSPFMQLQLLKSKIHRATVTDSSLHYEGSLTIAADLMDKVGLLPYEKVLCSNLANGERFETYAIPGEALIPVERIPATSVSRSPAIEGRIT